MGNKKARKGEGQVAQTQQDLANQDIAQNLPLTRDVTQFGESLLPTTGAGGPTGTTANLSPYAAAQYGSDLENINKTYGNLKQAGFNMLGAAGYGAAPSGERSSLVNTLLNNEAQAQTGAYRNALTNTLNEGVTGSGLLEGEQQINNPNVPLSGASGSYKNLYGMGSTLGDIATGITDAASIAAAPMTGGASLLAPGFAGLFNRGGGGSPDASLGIPQGTMGGGILSQNPIGSPVTPPTFSGGSTGLFSATASPGASGLSPGISPAYAPMPSAPSVAPASSTAPNRNGFNRLAQSAAA